MFALHNFKDSFRSYRPSVWCAVSYKW